MPPTVEDRLHDMREAIARIETITEARTFEQFDSDILVRMATERYLEIVCEASRHIPDDVKAASTNINWRAMIDFGNRLRHAYHATDVTLVWAILKTHVPALKTFIDTRLTAPDS